MMKKQMKTHFLMYRVCGKECPHGMTAEKCNLRKTFQDWQKTLLPNPKGFRISRSEQQKSGPPAHRLLSEPQK